MPMTVGVFHNTLDWTGVGTLALALVTAIALLVAWLTLRQSRGDTALLRREAEEAHRPVLVSACRLAARKSR